MRKSWRRPLVAAVCIGVVAYMCARGDRQAVEHIEQAAQRAAVAEAANAQAAPIIEQARGALARGDYAAAREHIATARAIPHATAGKQLHAAHTALLMLDSAEERGRALGRLTVGEFETLRDGALPARLHTGYADLDRAVLEALVPMLDAEGARRDELAKVAEEAQQKAEAERIAHAQEAGAAQAAAEREKIIAKSFSAWDGSHYEVTKLIKASMHDPGSYEHIETRYNDEGDYLVVGTEFRGKNLFGGMMKSWLRAKVKPSGEIIEVVSIGPGVFAVGGA